MRLFYLLTNAAGAFRVGLDPAQRLFRLPRALKEHDGIPVPSSSTVQSAIEDFLSHMSPKQIK